MFIMSIVVCLSGMATCTCMPKSTRTARAAAILFFSTMCWLALAGRNDLVDPAGERIVPAAATCNPRALGCGNQLALVVRCIRCAARSRFRKSFVPVSSIDWCISCFTCSMMSGEAGGDELHHMRAKLAGGRINNLKFFF